MRENRPGSRLGWPGPGPGPGAPAWSWARPKPGRSGGRPRRPPKRSLDLEPDHTPQRANHLRNSPLNNAQSPHKPETANSSSPPRLQHTSACLGVLRSLAFKGMSDDARPLPTPPSIHQHTHHHSPNSPGPSIAPGPQSSLVSASSVVQGDARPACNGKLSRIWNEGGWPAPGGLSHSTQRHTSAQADSRMVLAGIRVSFGSRD